VDRKSRRRFSDGDARGANWDAACFHSQQCAEKYLKAFLQEHAIKFEKIHNLIRLRQQCAQVGGTFELIRVHLEILNAYAVDIRYPRVLATKEEARDALKTVKEVRAFIRAKL
jgi:HEPN domain-containing protein